MTTKVINIVVPLDWDVPQIMSTFNEHENAFILNVGAELIKDARFMVAGFSQKEIYDKIREETKTEIQRLEMDLLVQKRLNSELDTSVRNVYNKQLEQMNRQIDTLRTQITTYEVDNKNVVKNEVEKEKENTK